ncbi:MAG: type II toxin-antitoxin system VapC family toxin [Caldilineaceae bacterium]
MEFLETSELVIDTNIIIDYLRRSFHALPLILAQYQCRLTVITLYEIQIAKINSSRQQQLFERVMGLTSILSLDVPAAVQAIQIERKLKAQGQLIGLPDIFIAGICLAQRIPLLTRNLNHFSRIEGLQVITPENLSGL